MVCRFRSDRNRPPPCWAASLSAKKQNTSNSTNSGPNWPSAMSTLWNAGVLIAQSLSMARDNNDSSVHSSAGRISTSRPRDMTPIRSHTRSSS